MTRSIVRFSFVVKFRAEACQQPFLSIADNGIPPLVEGIGGILFYSFSAVHGRHRGKMAAEGRCLEIAKLMKITAK